MTARSAGRGLAVSLAMLLSVLPGVQWVHAQSGPPQEQTVAELRQNLVQILQLARQAELVDQPIPDAQQAEAELLEADYDENVAPGLDFAEQDCFFAEVPVTRAVQWSRSVQELGLGDDYGPLWEEAAVVQDSLIKILRNCHKQMYEACVLNDQDPMAALLPGVTRQLGLMDDDQSYEDKTRRCQAGWHGKVTITERMQGNLSTSSGIGNDSTSTKVVIAGDRSMSIDLPGAGEAATGTANGHATQNSVSTVTAGQCTTTVQINDVRSATGSGASVLIKSSTDSGALTIEVVGPSETGNTSTAHHVTWNDSKCGQPADGDQKQPLPWAPWTGMINDTLSDPYAERISSSKTLNWVVNEDGIPVLARPDSSGGLSRIPAIPGAPPLPPDTIVEPVHPWLSPLEAVAGMDGDPPTIRMDISWDLTFGD